MADRLDLILDQLDALREQHVKTLIAVESFRCAQVEICKASTKQRETHDHVLFGNGKPGLVSVVQDMQTEIKRLKEIPPQSPTVSEVDPKNIILAVAAIGAFTISLFKGSSWLIGWFDK